MENFKLELTHQNGKKSELLPISFTYTVEDLREMSSSPYPLKYITKKEYVKDDISNFYKTIIKSSWPKFYHINSFVCNFNEKEEIYNIFKLLLDYNNMVPRKQIISEGKIQIETIDELKKFPVILDFQLHHCMPISVDYDNNAIEISVDGIEIKIPKSKNQK